LQLFSVALLVGILGVILWVYRESLESSSFFKDPSEPAGRNGKPHQLSLAELGRSHIFGSWTPRVSRVENYCPPKVSGYLQLKLLLLKLLQNNFLSSSCMARVQVIYSVLLVVNIINKI
jgi:hypothetical protein